MKERHTDTSSTYALEGGGFLHIDRVMVPMRVPRRLGADSPLKPKGQARVTKAKDEKMPTAKAMNRQSKTQI